MANKMLVFGCFVTLLCVFGWDKNMEARPALSLQDEQVWSVRAMRTGKASWYSRYDPGIKTHTANNEVFDDEQMTCAMWGVPFNQMVRVTNLSNGKSIVLRVNDRGPGERFVRQGRVIDLTKAAFEAIGSTEDGLIEVLVEYLS
jgi:rare lipoprotein A